MESDYSLEHVNWQDLKKKLESWVTAPDQIQEELWYTKDPFKADFLLQAFLLAEDLLYQIAEFKAYPMESTYSLLKDELVKDLSDFLLKQPLEEILRNLRLFRKFHNNLLERVKTALYSGRDVRKDLFFKNWGLEVASYVEFYPELQERERNLVESYFRSLRMSRSVPSSIQSFLSLQLKSGLIPDVEVTFPSTLESLPDSDENHLVTHLACSLKVIGHQNVVTMHMYGYSLPLNQFVPLQEQLLLIDTLEVHWSEFSEIHLLSERSKRSLLEMAAARVILELDGLVEEFRPDELHIIMESDIRRDWDLYHHLPFSIKELRQLGLGIIHFIENEVHERGHPYYLHYTPPRKDLRCPDCGGDVVPDIIEPLQTSFLQEKIIEINRLFREYGNLELLAKVIRRKKVRNRNKKIIQMKENLSSRKTDVKRKSLKSHEGNFIIYTLADSTGAIELHVKSTDSKLNLKVGKVYHLRGLRVKKTRYGWILRSTPWAKAVELPSTVMPVINDEENLSRLLRR